MPCWQYLSAKGKKKANYLILRKVLYYNAPEFFTQKASLPQWNKSYKIHFHKKLAVKADNGFYTICFYIKTVKPQQWIHVFLPQKGLFPTTDQLCLMSDKRNPDNGSHLLMRVIWPEKLSFFFLFFFGIVSFHSHFHQEEAASSGNLESVSKLENVANTNKE